MFFNVSVSIFCSDRLADHQKLNVIQKWTFYFSMTSRAFSVFLYFGHHFMLRSLGRSSEVKRNPKTNILFFNDLGGLFHFFVFWSTFFAGLLSRSSEVEHNPKTNILFFDDFGGLFCFFAFWSTFYVQIAWPIIRSWT